MVCVFLGPTLYNVCLVSPAAMCVSQPSKGAGPLHYAAFFFLPAELYGVLSSLSLSGRCRYAFISVVTDSFDDRPPFQPGWVGDFRGRLPDPRCPPIDRQAPHLPLPPSSQGTLIVCEPGNHHNLPIRPRRDDQRGLGFPEYIFRVLVRWPVGGSRLLLKNDPSGSFPRICGRTSERCQRALHTELQQHLPFSVLH